MYFDSHAHLTGDGVYEQLPAMLERAKKAGVGNVMNICTDVLTLERGLKISEEYSWVHSVGSTTPHDVAKEGESAFPIFAASARQGKLKAVGETGLDYHYEHSPVAIQKDFLRRYLHLALECHLPVVIHCREAFADLFEILDAEYSINGKLAPGVLHCFTGTMAEAEEVIKRGWYLSMSGIVTFKKSTELQEVAKRVPLDQLLIETDTPYLAPQPHRGKPNEPAFVADTATAVAALRSISVEEVANSTAENAKILFKI